MRVLVTGGAGYIGAITTRMLLDAGHQCLVYDSLERGHRESVDPRAEFVQGDIGDEPLLVQALDGCDGVLHFAGLIDVAESQREPVRYLAVNSERPVALLRAMESTGIQPIVFSSTAAVYGEPERIPIRESDPCLPVNVYGASKLAFEHRLAEFAERSVLRPVVLRYFNVAGAWPDGSLGEAHEPETHLIPRILQSIAQGHSTFEVFGGDYPTSDGTCVRDYVHVVDLARAHLDALEYLIAGGRADVFNLGSERGFTNREVVEACGRVTGRDVRVDVGPRREGDPAVLVASSEKAHEKLGWTPERGDIETIIEDAWGWHLARERGYR